MSDHLSVDEFERYLLNKLEESHNDELLYLKTRTVASELDVNTRQVGQLFSRHKSRSHNFDISRRTKTGPSGGAKWEIRLRDEPQLPADMICPACGDQCETIDSLRSHIEAHLRSLYSMYTLAHE